ncbi:hypothetical protein D9758_005790 [Tetrapyrgos nigripes]|uniref:Nudix hydrolase domain-containing protein n=1 Tax=Tetrapyrgos nigripes TaxID=182062 RepID=A0A8H5LQY8_9AGAR|nr:hypothetical protein D9758_005790 [Tetrapyrgos nigripes]
MDSPYPSSWYLAGEFVISAGSVLFRRSPEDPEKLQICLIYQRAKKEWLLPKGRKDCGESVELTAIRETYEETGYPCELLPCLMPTRAPEVGVNVKDAYRETRCTEPITISVRNQGDKGAKMTWWYISIIKGDGKKVEGTQMGSENFESEFIDADEALSRLTFKGDQAVAAQALAIVRKTLALDAAAASSSR